MKQETISNVKAILPEFTGRIHYTSQITLIREKNKRMDLFLPMINSPKFDLTEYQKLQNEILILNAAIIEMCDDLIAYEKTHF